MLIDALCAVTIGRRVTRNVASATIINRWDTGMVEMQEDQGNDDQQIESLSPEETGLSKARQALLRTMLTPVWWIFGIPISELLDLWFPGDPNPTIVYVIWSIFALLLPFSGTVAGVMAWREIREHETQTGLWIARFAAIFGVIFGTVSLISVVAIITT